ncbi:unnamed protein product [Rangifer tarandus platyrhynchus]|uniref:Uncharacterized protein n=2 Tax=Rangifer tarandus platyrhynchus TaxID=3082113 RepID=A0ABN8ZWE3_RANTA|nr:unnamed protein product [Rangifer tarandus platyrhynchus]CAI9711236.1 unnamed protein product [Rangifer tarandus platyrhynchus]
MRADQVSGNWRTTNRETVTNGQTRPLFRALCLLTNPPAPHREPAASDRKPAGQSLEAPRGGRSHAIRGVGRCWGPAGQLTRWGGGGTSGPSVKGQEREFSALQAAGSLRQLLNPAQHQRSRPDTVNP